MYMDSVGGMCINKGMLYNVHCLGRNKDRKGGRKGKGRKGKCKEGKKDSPVSYLPLLRTVSVFSTTVNVWIHSFPHWQA